MLRYCLSAIILCQVLWVIFVSSFFIYVFFISLSKSMRTRVGLISSYGALPSISPSLPLVSSLLSSLTSCFACSSFILLHHAHPSSSPIILPLRVKSDSRSALCSQHPLTHIGAKIPEPHSAVQSSRYESITDWR